MPLYLSTLAYGVFASSNPVVTVEQWARMPLLGISGVPRLLSLDSSSVCYEHGGLFAHLAALPITLCLIH